MMDCSVQKIGLGLSSKIAPIRDSQDTHWCSGLGDMVGLGVSMGSKRNIKTSSHSTKQHQAALASFQLKGTFYGKEELSTLPRFVSLIKAAINASAKKDDLSEHSDKSIIPSKSAESDT